MIEAYIYYKDKQVYGFKIKNHANSHVCAAVSMFSINTINSIESLTDDDFTCDYNEKGGFIDFKLKYKPSIKASVLLDALKLGLVSAKKEHPKEIKIIESEVII